MKLFSKLKAQLDLPTKFTILAIILIGMVWWKSSKVHYKELSLPTIVKSDAQCNVSRKNNIALHAGDSVRIVGMYTDMTFLVDTKDGQRGIVSQTAICDTLLYIGDGEKGLKHGDTVYCQKAKTSKDAHLIVSKAGGKQVKIFENKVISILGNRIRNYTLENVKSFYLTMADFEKSYMGKPYSEVGKPYGRVYKIEKRKDGSTAVLLCLSIFNSKDGHFYNPVIIYKNGIATSYTVEKTLQRNNSWLLKILPFTNAIIGNKFLSSLMSDDFYKETDERIEQNIFLTIIGLIGLIVFFILYLGWLCFAGMIPSFLFMTLIKIRYPLVWMSNTIASVTSIALCLIGTYIWLILGLTHYYWWILIPLTIVALRIIQPQLLDFFTYQPPSRCPNCKRLEKMEPVKEEVIGEWDERHKESERHLYDSKKAQWKTWTQVTTTGPYGQTSSHRENEKTHTKTTNKYHVDTFDVLYHVKEIVATWRCRACGHEVYLSRKDYTTLDKRKTGAYNTSETHVETH